MSKIKFGEPKSSGKKVYGVAFVEDECERTTIGFSIELRRKNIWELNMEDSYLSKEVYNFFLKLLKSSLKTNAGLSKNAIMRELHVDFILVEEKIQEILDKIEYSMGFVWNNAFKNIFSYLE